MAVQGKKRRGFQDQPRFLNLVTRGQTSLSPEGLLHAIRAIEEQAGRTRAFENAPRTLDIDIIFYGQRIVRAPGLTIPHPSWKGRSFVSLPLFEVEPSFVDPCSGWRVSDVVNSWPMEPEQVEIVDGPPAL